MATEVEIISTVCSDIHKFENISCAWAKVNSKAVAVKGSAHDFSAAIQLSLKQLLVINVSAKKEKDNNCLLVQFAEGWSDINYQWKTVNSGKDLKLVVILSHQFKFVDITFIILWGYVHHPHLDRHLIVPLMYSFYSNIMPRDTETYSNCLFLVV